MLRTCLRLGVVSGLVFDEDTLFPDISKRVPGYEAEALDCGLSQGQLVEVARTVMQKRGYTYTMRFLLDASETLVGCPEGTASPVTADDIRRSAEADLSALLQSYLPPGSPVNLDSAKSLLEYLVVSVPPDSDKYITGYLVDGVEALATLAMELSVVNYPGWVTSGSSISSPLECSNELRFRQNIAYYQLRMKEVEIARMLRECTAVPEDIRRLYDEQMFLHVTNEGSEYCLRSRRFTRFDFFSSKKDRFHESAPPVTCDVSIDQLEYAAKDTVRHRGFVGGVAFLLETADDLAKCPGNPGAGIPADAMRHDLVHDFAASISSTISFPVDWDQMFRLARMRSPSHFNAEAAQHVVQSASSVELGVARVLQSFVVLHLSGIKAGSPIPHTPFMLTEKSLKLNVATAIESGQALQARRMIQYAKNQGMPDEVRCEVEDWLRQQAADLGVPAEIQKDYESVWRDRVADSLAKVPTARKVNKVAAATAAADELYDEAAYIPDLENDEDYMTPSILPILHGNDGGISVSSRLATNFTKTGRLDSDATPGKLREAFYYLAGTQRLPEGLAMLKEAENSEYAEELSDVTRKIRTDLPQSLKKIQSTNPANWVKTSSKLTGLSRSVFDSAALRHVDDNDSISSILAYADYKGDEFLKEQFLKDDY